MSIFNDFVKFATKYGQEATAIGTALNGLLDNLPIEKQDRERIKTEVSKLSGVASNIAAWAVTAKEPPVVKINATDIKKAVAEYLKSSEGKAAIAASVAAKDGK